MPRIFGLITLFAIQFFCISKAFSFEAYASDNTSEATFFSESETHDHEESYDEVSSLWNIEVFACTPATASNIATINKGNEKLNRFLSQCSTATNHSKWCQQLIRPNPASVETFRCTYGESQPHRLIHPDESTWTNAIRAVTYVDQLETMGIRVAQIYNWWRPEPYNANVGGAAGRHPYGTSVDVRFQTMNDMERAHAQLCKWRKSGDIRAVGYYGSTGLHFGIGDKTPNTWGKDCP